MTSPGVEGRPALATRTISAVGAARLNWDANLRSLAATQPGLSDTLRGASADVDWTFGRDGALTAFGPDGKWWQGCSVPRAAAGAMLSSLDAKGRVVCLLAPTLAAHVRSALGRCAPDQAVVSIIPDWQALAVLLHCEDFSRDFSSHRLWFAWGDEWPARLGQLFEDRPGLATPTQFVRLPVTPAEQVEHLISAGQAVFAAANVSRRAAVQHLNAVAPRRHPDRRRICVVGPSHFRLWGDAGDVLADALARSAPAAGVDVVRFDPDDPACSSALAFAAAAAGCDAVVTADTMRTDLPAVVPPAVPWITWVTAPNLAAPVADGTNDALIVADPAWRARAVDAGWRAERVVGAGWPVLQTQSAPPLADPAPPALVVIADTTALDPDPPALAEYSSHQLLWTRIACEIAADPFVVGDHPVSFLRQHQECHAVRDDGLDVSLFVRQLILPAYAQSVVRILMHAGLPLRLFGSGWDQTDEFRSLSAGKVTSKTELARATAGATAVVDVWPTAVGTLVARLGRPVLRRGPEMTPDQFCTVARAILRGGAPEHSQPAPLSIAAILQLLPALSSRSY